MCIFLYLAYIALNCLIWYLSSVFHHLDLFSPTWTSMFDLQGPLLQLLNKGAQGNCVMLFWIKIHFGQYVFSFDIWCTFPIFTMFTKLTVYLCLYSKKTADWDLPGVYLVDTDFIFLLPFSQLVLHILRLNLSGIRFILLNNLQTTENSTMVLSPLGM